MRKRIIAGGRYGMKEEENRCSEVLQNCSTDRPIVFCQKKRHLIHCNRKEGREI